MYERHVPGPFLVVVPLSTIAARVREVIRRLPEMNVVCYTGDASSRGMIRQYEFDPLRGSKSKGNSVKFHFSMNHSRTCNDGHGPSGAYPLGYGRSGRSSSPEKTKTVSCAGLFWAFFSESVVSHGKSFTEFSGRAMGIAALSEYRPV
jgi:hypothetical protein